MVLQIGDDGTGVWAQLGAKRIRIGFERKHVSRRADDFKFIDGAFGKLGKKKFPNTRRTASAHGMDAAVPAIEVTNNADALGARGPNGKVNAANAFEGEVFLIEPLGSSVIYDVRIGETILKVLTSPNFTSTLGQRVWVELNDDKIHLFNRRTSELVV